MKRIAGHLIGVDQGDALLFSDFEDDGEMWTGSGERERLIPVSFSQAFAVPPSVQCSMSLLDLATGPSIRADVTPNDITETGFTIRFRTWGDSRVARIRVAWMAIGELPDAEAWQLY